LEIPAGGKGLSARRTQFALSTTLLQCEQKHGWQGSQLLSIGNEMKPNVGLLTVCIRPNKRAIVAQARSLDMKKRQSSRG
jgi:hypothetical protein